MRHGTIIIAVSGSPHPRRPYNIPFLERLFVIEEILDTFTLQVGVVVSTSLLWCTAGNKTERNWSNRRGSRYLKNILPTRPAASKARAAMR